MPSPQAASKLMIAQRIKGKLIFVSSFIGYTSFAGYSTYAPGKYALRGEIPLLFPLQLTHPPLPVATHEFVNCASWMIDQTIS